MDTSTKERPIVMVAMGGHAFMKPGRWARVDEHVGTPTTICDRLMVLVERGYNLVITHGNGPQVGHQLIKNELTTDEVPSWPMDVLVAETEGSLGYILQQALLNQLRGRKIERYVVAVICQVLVDPDDPAFRGAHEADRPLPDAGGGRGPAATRSAGSSRRTRSAAGGASCRPRIRRRWCSAG